MRSGLSRLIAKKTDRNFPVGFLLRVALYLEGKLHAKVSLQIIVLRSVDNVIATLAEYTDVGGEAVLQSTSEITEDTSVVVPFITDLVADKTY
jgi:hypothetical protein